MRWFCSACVLLTLTVTASFAGEPHPIVRDILAMKPCGGYLKSSVWGTTLDDAEKVLRASGPADTIMRQPSGVLAVVGRPSKDIPLDSISTVITATYNAGTLFVGCTVKFATEQEAKDAVMKWNEVAGQTWGRQKGRENEYWAATCPDGSKLMALGITINRMAMFSVMFLHK